MAASIGNNAIAYAQIKLKGGWRNILITTVVTAVLVTATMLATSHFGSGDVWMAWSRGLLAMQTFLLVLFGASRVSAAIRGDISSGMIESHRLMPTSAPAAIFGYVFGAPIQAIALGFVAVFTGSIASAGGGDPLETWIGANLILALFAAAAWLGVAAFSFGSRAAMAFLIVPIVVAFSTQGAVLELLPGFMVLCTPLIRDTIFSGNTSITSLHFGYVVGAAAQICIGTISFIAACRKYRRVDATAFTPTLALALLAGWAFFSFVAMSNWDAFAFRGMRYSQVETNAQVIGAMTFGMLLGILPVASATRADVDRKRRRLIDDPSLRGRSMPPIVAVVAATALITSMSAVAIGPTQEMASAGCTAAVVFLYLLWMMFLLRAAYLRNIRPFLVGLLATSAVWLGPLLAEIAILLTSATSTPGSTYVADPLATFPGALAVCSPPAAFVRFWRDKSEPRLEMPAITAQVFLVLAAALLARAAEKRKASPPAPWEDGGRNGEPINTPPDALAAPSNI